MEQTRTLLAKLRAGDDAALVALIERERRRVVGVLAGVIGSIPNRDDLVEELFHEVQLHAIQHMADFSPRGPGAFGRWLAEIARRKARHAISRRKSHASLERTGIRGTIAAGRTTPASAAIRAELGRDLFQAMDRLSDDHRLVITLRYFEGLNGPAVAAEMKRSEPAVRQLYVRAMTELGRHLRRLAEEAAA